MPERKRSWRAEAEAMMWELETLQARLKALVADMRAAAAAEEAEAARLELVTMNEAARMVEPPKDPRTLERLLRSDPHVAGRVLVPNGDGRYLVRAAPLRAFLRGEIACHCVTAAAEGEGAPAATVTPLRRASRRTAAE